MLDAFLEELQNGKFTENLSITDVKYEDKPNVSLAETNQGNQAPTSITVTVEAIHAGMTKNKTFYPADKLEASVPTWTSPYNKPVIKNHDTWEEPNGRVMDAWFQDSVLKPDTKTIGLKMVITDPDVIQKVMDGRYQTLSIGGSTDQAICSICGKNIVTEGWCGHSKGRTYDGKEAYWIIGNMEFNEISWVNVPADVNARVISIKQNNTSTAGGRKESVEDTNLIDDILNENLNGEPTPEGTQTEDTEKTPEGATQTESTEGTPEGTEGTPEGTEGAAQTTESEKTDAEKLADALVKIQEQKDIVKMLEGDRTSITAERDTLKTEIVTLTEGNTTKDTEITLLKEERDGFRDKNITLAKAAHKFLAESAVNLRIALGEASLEEKAGLLTDYAKTPAKVLENTINDLLVKPKADKPRESTKVNNPGAVVTDGAHSTNADGEITESTGTTEKTVEVDIEELASRMIGVIAGRGQF